VSVAGGAVPARLPWALAEKRTDGRGTFPRGATCETGYFFRRASRFAVCGRGDSAMEEAKLPFRVNASPRKKKKNVLLLITAGKSFEHRKINDFDPGAGQREGGVRHAVCGGRNSVLRKRWFTVWRLLKKKQPNNARSGNRKLHGIFVRSATNTRIPWRFAGGAT